jgi:hypothetical protein
VSVEPCATREIAQAEADDLNACAPSPPTQHSTIDHAKQIVIDHGPAIALELTEEVVQQSAKDLSDEEKAQLMAEVQHQAERTYRFLGYEPPCGWIAHLN